MADPVRLAVMVEPARLDVIRDPNSDAPGRATTVAGAP
jgi:hypothetical protein